QALEKGSATIYASPARTCSFRHLAESLHRSWAPHAGDPCDVRRTSLKENRNDQDGDNVHHLDHRIGRGTGRVLVGIAHGIARDRSCVGWRSFATVIALL